MAQDLPFEIAPVDAPAPEQADAQAYWAGIDFSGYKKPVPWSEWMADAALSYHPERVFEFGCNTGRNLRVVKDKAPGVFVAGLDVNAEAVAFGRNENGLGLAAGDASTLLTYPPQSFDVCFTVSVLDHIAEPAIALERLAAMAAKSVLLLEPWMGEEGRVVRNTTMAGAMVDTTPFSYSWDYGRLAREVLPDWRFSREPMPLKSNLGPFYELFRLERITGSND